MMHFETWSALPVFDAVIAEESYDELASDAKIFSNECIVPAGSAVGVNEPASVSRKSTITKKTLTMTTSTFFMPVYFTTRAGE
jgi:hypothetical protein